MLFSAKDNSDPRKNVEVYNVEIQAKLSWARLWLLAIPDFLIVGGLPAVQIWLTGHGINQSRIPAQIW